MSSSQIIPELHLQPIAVDFVDNRLPKLHPAFTHSISKYDAKLDRYIPSNPASSSKMQSDYSGSHSSVPSTVKQIAICGSHEIIPAMLFWDTIFPDAMIWLKEKFEEPKDRCVTGYSIRDMKDWTEVYQVVENCRDKYLNGGRSMIMKRGLRWFADNITPFQESLKLIPDVDYVSPVRGTLGFIMDAVKRASETRQKLLQGLDNLDNIFKDIELFLNTFPTEKNVCEAGRDLVVSVLVAAEKLIGFYLKQKGKKVVAALFKGDDYEKSVVNSLQDITTRSENLRHEATKADMSQSARNWKLAEHRHNELRESQIVLQDGQERIIHNQDTQAGNLTRTIQAGVRIMSNGMNDIYNLMVEHERNKDRQTAELLQRNADLQKQVSDLKYTTDVLQRALTPKLTATSGGGWHVTPNDLWDMFGDRCFDDRDTQYTLDMQEQVPIHDRAIAESLVTLPRFREWMVVATSRELLVHGNSPSNHPISPLSVFCSTFSQALRQNPRFISLVYFCSLHADYDDPNAGPQCMMMSFIAQLILQGEFDTTFLHHDVDVSWVERDEEPYMEDLCEMMKWLIYQLPAEMTVFCVIDGVNAYEKGPYVHDFVDGLACVMDLVIDPNVQATVKVLATSPSRTLEVREGFHDDDMVVLTTGQLHVNMEASPRHSQHKISRVLENSEREYF